MGMLYLLFFLVLIICRFFAGYDSRYQNGKYIVIRNPKIRPLLMDSISFYNRTKRIKKDINKISVMGVILYAVAAVSLVGSVVVRFVVPAVSVDPLVIETDEFIMRADTLNILLSAAFIWAFLLTCLIFVAVGIMRITKKEKKWVRVLTYIAAAFIFVTVGFFTWEIVTHIFGFKNLYLENLKFA